MLQVGWFHWEVIRAKVAWAVAATLESCVTIMVGKQRHQEQGGGDGSCSLELLQGGFEERGANGREAGDDTKLAPYATQ